MAGYHRKKSIVESCVGEKSVIIAAENIKVPSGDVRLTVGEVERLYCFHEEIQFFKRPGRDGRGLRKIPL